jgi:hypothetical protein
MPQSPRLNAQGRRRDSAEKKNLILHYYGKTWKQFLVIVECHCAIQLKR